MERKCDKTHNNCYQQDHRLCAFSFLLTLRRGDISWLRAGAHPPIYTAMLCAPKKSNARKIAQLAGQQKNSPQAAHRLGGARLN
jgi:hypothetical protein